MFSFLKSRRFLILIGFVLIALFIWYAGPYFAFGEYHPLEPATARLIVIALVVAFWFGSVVMKRLRASRVSEQLVAAVVNQAKGEPPSAEALKLRERFEEGVAVLKQQGRRGRGRSLYEMPWYVIIGAPGSGKTTALLNSGLKFPLEQRVGKGALRGVGGTRNCDWWFTDEAVFLDTAGRYTTQDSDATSDVAGWQEFLALLLKYRKRRPLNGVILTISAHDLLTQGEAGREVHADAARRRLRELNEQLRIQLPVYLMVTKCDLVAGFTEYFDDLTQEGRAQVWGVTFPYEQTLNGQATRAFPSEFDALMTRLNSRLFARLEEDRDVRRRTAVFAFPQQIAALRDYLTHFVQEVLEPSRVNQQILLRGVYLTSGTQEGTPIDRLLGAIGRRFGVAPEAVAPPTGRGKAYFVERLLKEVMIGESGLAGVNRRVEMRNAAMQLGTYAAMAFVTIVGVIALSVSYGRNRTYLGEIDAEVEKLRGAPPVRAGAPTETLLPRLDAVRAVVDSADRYRTDTPLSMRWGLFQGTSVGKSARDAYLRELEGLVMPVFAGRLKRALIDRASEPDRLYEYLKAYLMLGDPQHFDREYLQSVADAEWNESSRTPEQGKALSKHFQSLLEYADPLRPIALDAALVAQARSTIRQASIPQIMYGELKRAYSDDDQRAIRLDVAAGARAEDVLQRASTKLSTPIPSLYSKVVFNEVTTKRVPVLVAQFTKDSWVWGEGGMGSVSSAGKLANDLTDVYEGAYIDVWDAVLSDVQIVPLTSAQQAADALGVLSAAASPLRGLLRTVVDNTMLVEPAAAPPTTGLGAAKKNLTDKLGRALKGAKEVAGLSTATPGSIVTAHFQAIQQVLAGAPGTAPIDKVIAQFAQMQQLIQTSDPGAGPVLNSPAFRTALQTLRQAAAALPPGAGSLVVEIGTRTEGSAVDEWSNQIRAQYQQEVLRECNSVVTNRYPFVATTAMEMTLADFTRMFGWNGIFDRFFNENLQDHVIADEGPWRWRNSAVKLGTGMLAQLKQARFLRDLLFPQPGQLPQVTFTVMITDEDRADRRFVLQVDGQNADNRRGGQRQWQVKWPFSDPGFAAVTFEPWPPTKRFDGAWAWLHLIEAGQPQHTPPLRTVLSFRQGDYISHVTIETTSNRNPFVNQEWRQFRCGS